VGDERGQFNLTFDSDSFRFDVVFDDGLVSDISNLSGGEKVLVACLWLSPLASTLQVLWNLFSWMKA